MKIKLFIGHHIIVVLFFCVVHTSLGYAQCDTTYIIQSGDELGKNAQKFKQKYPDPDYHINDDSIKEWNGLKNDKIYAGRSLKIKIPCEPNNQANETASQEEETQGKVSGDPKTSGARSGAKPEQQERTEKSKISLWWLWLLLGGIAGVLCWEKFIRERVPHLFKSNQSKKKPATPTVSTSSLKKEIQRLQTENDSLTKENEELHTCDVPHS